jgi:exopolysaccharide biosynthesis polyprenyl glycosylphosphotransferase
VTTTDASRSMLLEVAPPEGMPGLRAGDFAGAEPAVETVPATPAEQFRAAPLARRHRLLLRAADALALSAAAALGAVTLEAVQPIRAGDIALRQVLVTALAMAVAFHLHGLYRRPASRLRPSGWWRPWVVARCLPTAALTALAADAVLVAGDRMTLTAAVAMTTPALVLVPFGRRTMIRAFGPPTVTRILAVGTGQVADRLAARLGRCADTVLVGAVDDTPMGEHPVLGGLDDLPRLCQEHAIDRIVVAFTITPDSDLLERLRQLGGHVPISVIPRLFELHSWRSEVEELHGMPLLHVPPATLGAGARVAKRVLDLTVALTVLLVGLPFGLLFAAAIKLDSPGPVLFRQNRMGRAGREFTIFKFRTMSNDAWEKRAAVAGRNEVDGPLFKMARDPRVTRIGRLLRRTSIDELPQLLNVVLGEMSLVGPRPLPTEESRRLDGAALARFDVAPGLTGLWQVSGRSDLTYADLQHLDSVYVRSWSLLWDLRIILATPRSVFGGRGAY